MQLQLFMNMKIRIIIKRKLSMISADQNKAPERIGQKYTFCRNFPNFQFPTILLLKPFFLFLFIL